MKHHKFKFNLPLDTREAELEMDGVPLKGVTGLTLRAGTNGFTNVVLEFSAPALAEFDAVLITTVNPDDAMELALAAIYDEALLTVEKGLDGDPLGVNPYARSHLVKEILKRVANIGD